MSTLEMLSRSCKRFQDCQKKCNEPYGMKSDSKDHNGRAIYYGYFGYQLYAPQTKILEGRTNISERVFEALFNDS